MSKVLMSGTGTLRFLKGVALAGIGIAALGLTTDSSQARIACEGPYQIIQGQLHATPYCEDNYLAAVAREYGMRVSNAAIRNNPHEKQRACLFVGDDIRVQDICAGYRPDGNRIFP